MSPQTPTRGRRRIHKISLPLRSNRRSPSGSMTGRGVCPTQRRGPCFLAPVGPCHVLGKASSRRMPATAFLPSNRRLQGAPCAIGTDRWLGLAHGMHLAPRPPTPGAPHAVGPSQIPNRYPLKPGEGVTFSASLVVICGHMGLFRLGQGPRHTAAGFPSRRRTRTSQGLLLLAAGLTMTECTRTLAF